MNPPARERKNKTRAILAVLFKFEEYEDFVLGRPCENEAGKWEKQLIKLCEDFTTMDRSWRQILQQRPELRGEDYDMKEVLSQEKQLELGYTPGFHSDIKKGKEL